MSACRSESKIETQPSAATPQPRVIGGPRPVRAFRPAKQQSPAPLILVLHGYGGDGPSQLGWFGVSAIDDAHVLAPDGTLDATGRRFWNATDTCCDFEARRVDDVKYLLSLIDDVAANHPVDRARVYAIGLSNGGAMALRLACDAADKIAAVVSVAAPMPEAATCAPSRPVAIRQLHGTADQLVKFNGGARVKVHPNAHGQLAPVPAIADLLARANGCGTLVEERTLDIDRSVPGAETTVSRATDCKPGGETELWVMRGSAHGPPPFAPLFLQETRAYLNAHHR